MTVDIKKNMCGKVIGKGGSTKKDIESDYSVVLEFPESKKNTDNGAGAGRSDDGNEIVTIKVIGNSKEKCEAAVRRIKDISGQLENDPIETNARDKVKKIRDEVDRLFTEAKSSTDKKKKDELYKQANDKKNELEVAEKEAADVIFKNRNKGYGLDQLDLHGLYVRFAIDYVRERLDILQDKKNKANVPVLSIITGIGNHSEGNVAKIKPAIEELLNERGLKYNLDETVSLLLPLSLLLFLSTKETV